MANNYKTAYPIKICGFDMPFSYEKYYSNFNFPLALI